MTGKDFLKAVVRGEVDILQILLTILGEAKITSDFLISAENDLAH